MGQGRQGLGVCDAAAEGKGLARTIAFQHPNFRDVTDLLPLPGSAAHPDGLDFPDGTPEPAASGAPAPSPPVGSEMSGPDGHD